MTAPVAVVSMDYIKNYDEIHEKMADLAKEVNAPYVDYNLVNRQTQMLTNENFRDDAHLNDSGVKIVDEHFADWLVQNTVFFRQR